MRGIVGLTCAATLWLGGCQPGPARVAPTTTTIELFGPGTDFGVGRDRRRKTLQEEALKRAQVLVVASVGVINLATGLAAPRILGGVERMPPKVEMVHAVDVYLAHLQLMERTSLEETEEPARILRAKLQAWTPSRDVPTDIVQAARALLRAFGIIEPPQGWDKFVRAPAPDAPALASLPQVRRIEAHHP
ncbi:hypothetical protein [Polyangium aurulentum]|uniref:hypothetical protein n=1 Tax=Polyangium aurulentum TaxID=2567896 RepID=UPI00113EA822|nr:hypothetical protein [Polyangium aurulentum]UQA60221.1 hypothetical protein E8A73_007005 [Polyangium aurulentum]